MFALTRIPEALAMVLPTFDCTFTRERHTVEVEESTVMLLKLNF
jgi:hypothetical protein